MCVRCAWWRFHVFVLMWIFDLSCANCGIKNAACGKFTTNTSWSYTHRKFWYYAADNLFVICDLFKADICGFLFNSTFLTRSDFSLWYLYLSFTHRAINTLIHTSDNFTNTYLSKHTDYKYTLFHSKQIDESESWGKQRWIKGRLCVCVCVRVCVCVLKMVKQGVIWSEWAIERAVRTDVQSHTVRNSLPSLIWLRWICSLSLLLPHLVFDLCQHQSWHNEMLLRRASASDACCAPAHVTPRSSCNPNPAVTQLYQYLSIKGGGATSNVHSSS